MLFSESSTGVPVLLPCCLDKQERGTLRKLLTKPQFILSLSIRVMNSWDQVKRKAGRKEGASLSPPICLQGAGHATRMCKFIFFLLPFSTQFVPLWASSPIPASAM